MWCSCGVWQDMLLPCRHACCAMYRKSKSSDRKYILANLIDEYYTHGCVQTTFTNNIYPVSLDTVAYNGETKPPLGSKRSSGRPRTKRIRRPQYSSFFYVFNVWRCACLHCMYLLKKHAILTYRVCFCHRHYVFPTLPSKLCSDISFDVLCTTHFNVVGEHFL